MPKYRAGHVVGKDEVLAAIGASDTCTLNALRPDQHAGTGGSVYGRLGHIKGSINVAAVNGVNGHNEFKSADELRVQFADALAKPRVITYWGLGSNGTRNSVKPPPSPLPVGTFQARVAF